MSDEYRNRLVCAALAKRGIPVKKANSDQEDGLPLALAIVDGAARVVSNDRTGAVVGETEDHRATPTPGDVFEVGRADTSRADRDQFAALIRHIDVDDGHTRGCRSHRGHADLPRQD